MRALLVLAASLICHAAGAQAMRDPTIAPNTAGSSSEVGDRDPLANMDGPLSVVIVDGKPHLMGGTRLYAQGQMLGQARIERITETEIWLREGGQLRKVKQFPGVLRRNITDKASP